jgi:hypothetical protein
MNHTVNFLNGRYTLLLDNCAHLLQNCPDLRLLSTSRDTLGLMQQLGVIPKPT